MALQNLMTIINAKHVLKRIAYPVEKIILNVTNVYLDMTFLKKQEMNVL